MPEFGLHVSRAEAAPSDGLGEKDLVGTLETAVENERRTALSRSARARVATSGLLFAVVALVGLVTGDPAWIVLLTPIALHVAGAAILFVMRERPLATVLAPLSAVADVALVLWAQTASLDVAPNPGLVAGMSLGLFVLLVALNALTMRAEVVWLTCVAAALAQFLLLHWTGGQWASQVASCAVLVLAAAAALPMAHRLDLFVRSYTVTDAAREIERSRREQEEDARRTIERMLDDARRRNAELARLQQAKDRLTQLLVHDLRTPLTAVVGWSDLLAMQATEKGDAEPIVAEAAREVQRGAQQLQAMVADLLDIARAEDGRLVLRRERFPARELVTAGGTRAAALSRTPIVVETASPDGLEVDGDRTLLQRVLDNLVSNAVKYVPQNGRLLVEVRGGDVLTLAVRNDGPPIEAEARARLFEPFSQGTGESRRGWGLGLYFCRLVAEEHGGSVGLEDAPGWATSIVVRLPKR